MRYVMTVTTIIEDTPRWVIRAVDPLGPGCNFFYFPDKPDLRPGDKIIVTLETLYDANTSDHG